MMDFFESLSKRAQIKRKRILFPEGNQAEIIKAAVELSQKKLADPILLSQDNQVQTTAEQFGLSLENIEVLNIEDEVLRDSCIKKYLATSEDFTEKRLRIKWKNPLNAAAILLRIEYGDSLVAGLTVTTEAVILTAINFVGLAPEYTFPSSSFIMEIPGFTGDQGELLVFADCAVCVDPDPQELSEIALATAETMKKMLNWQPKIAFLSFSTNRSGEGESVKKVREAAEIVSKKTSEFSVVGEVQADAALVRAIANKKLEKQASIKGDANILIFPNLDAGNIAYKLVQITTRGNAYGPILQGFSKPVADLSRGASVKDIIGTSLISSLLSE